MFSGTCGLIVGHPLDTIKVWKQTIPEKTSLTNVVVTLFKLEGVSLSHAFYCQVKVMFVCLRNNDVYPN